MTLNLPVYAWNVSPTWSQVVQFEQHNPHEKHVVWCVLPDSVPHYELTSPQNEYESSLHLAIQNALSCATTQAVHCVPECLAEHTFVVDTAVPSKQPSRAFFCADSMANRSDCACARSLAKSMANVAGRRLSRPKQPAHFDYWRRHCRRGNGV